MHARLSRSRRLAPPPPHLVTPTTPRTMRATPLRHHPSHARRRPRPSPAKRRGAQRLSGSSRSCRLRWSRASLCARRTTTARTTSSSELSSRRPKASPPPDRAPDAQAALPRGHTHAPLTTRPGPKTLITLPAPSREAISRPRPRPRPPPRPRPCSAQLACPLLRADVASRRHIQRVGAQLVLLGRRHRPRSLVHRSASRDWLQARLVMSTHAPPSRRACPPSLPPPPPRAAPRSQAGLRGDMGRYGEIWGDMRLDLRRASRRVRW